jgi:hypothetical protein
MHKQKPALIGGIMFVLVILMICGLANTVSAAPKRPKLVLMNQRGDIVSNFNISDSVFIGVKNLIPHRRYSIRILQDNSEIASSHFEANASGEISPNILWYDVGIVYDAKGNGRLNVEKTIDSRYVVEVRAKEKLILKASFKIFDLAYIPRIFVTDEEGNIRTSFLKGESQIYLRGENFPPGVPLRAYLVKAQRTWENNDELNDVSGEYRQVKLDSRVTSFKDILLAKRDLGVGSYDVVVDFSPMDGHFSRSAISEASDVISKYSMSGFVLYDEGVGHIEQDMACQAPAHDPVTMAVYGAPNPIYRNSFSADEEIWMTIDPYFKGNNLVGKKARIYVVKHKTAAQWDTNNSLMDESGGWEETTIQPGCANVNYIPIWLNPKIDDYDVVMDFQLPDGMYNGVYDKGIDIVDMADDVGFTIPSSWVTLNQIKFNHDLTSNLSDGITIKQNNSVNITAPEWTKTGKAQSVAYVRDKSVAIKARFTANSSVTSAKIRAIGGSPLGDLGEVTVNFSGGVSNYVSFYPANKTPNQVDFRYLTWKWKYRDANGSGSTEVEMATSSNKTFIVLSNPLAPMQAPWVDGILERACLWAKGENIEANIVAKLTDNAYYYTGKTYNGYNSHASNSIFNLTTFLQATWADCQDMSAYLHVLCRALGISTTMLRIGGGFDTKPILAIGNTVWNDTTWNFHRVGSYNTKVYDACLMLNQSSPIVPKDMDVNGNYKAGLYDSGTWSPGTPFDITNIY